MGMMSFVPFFFVKNEEKFWCPWCQMDFSEVNEDDEMKVKSD